MGQRGKAGRLSARCPVCDEQLDAADLPTLLKLVGRHCRTKRNKVAAPVDRPVPLLPLLPWRCEVDRSVISQNKTTYAHWTVYSRDKRKWMSHLEPLTRELHGLNLSWSRWRVERHYAPPMREMDYGNVVGGFKPALDCLKELGIIVDDRPTCFEASYAQVNDTRRYTALILEAVCV